MMGTTIALGVHRLLSGRKNAREKSGRGENMFEARTGGTGVELQRAAEHPADGQGVLLLSRDGRRTRNLMVDAGFLAGLPAGDGGECLSWGSVR